ncbi:hypothetical protein FNV43_RR15950 [Rhamnella rubrinervis]|uniref:Pentatricopeptide repeat-containing protein n=1 Tax=Rhamnella rubrinervis TaxID=2594499 RepID=A0A8K0E9V6_9ROSA|nr:hypothetical protein FNV43_RR15950 [Rhamnella rubrinervis]
MKLISFFQLLVHRKTHSSACSLLVQSQKGNHSALKQGSSAAQPQPVSTPCSQSNPFLDACKLFDELSDLGVVSATAIIGQFARRNRNEEAVYLFSRMLVADIRPNEFTFGTVVHSSTELGHIHIGKQLHACATKIGLHRNVFVGTALLDFYGKLSSIENAQRAFEDTNNPNVVSYTTLICGQTGHNEEAVNLFIEMLKAGLIPNHSSFPCAITATANIAALGLGRGFHACAVKFLGNKLDVFVGNSLISFYAKCGSMEDRQEAISFFQRMQRSGCEPNSVTLLGLLWACNHSGLVDQGYSYFHRAKLEHPSILKPEHYACMVDLLSRSGRFTQAEEFIKDLPFDPGIGFWKALLNGCQIHSNVDLGELAAKKILGLDPEDVSSYVMLSNAHSAAGRWQRVSVIRREMKEKGMKRVPGCSWIEIRNKVHVFVTGDRNHPHKDQIYMVLSSCIESLKENELSNYYVFAES